MTTERSREQRLRRLASRYDLAIQKSRTKYIHADDMGGYRIIDPQNNTVVHGARLDLTLDDVENYFMTVRD